MKAKNISGYISRWKNSLKIEIANVNVKKIKKEIEKLISKSIYLSLQEQH